MLDGDLPDRSGAHGHEVLRLLDGCPSLADERLIVDERPDDDVRIEKKPQPGYAGKISLA
jgi:hypothetical protein